MKMANDFVSQGITVQIRRGDNVRDINWRVHTDKLSVLILMECFPVHPQYWVGTI